MWRRGMEGAAGRRWGSCRPGRGGDGRGVRPLRAVREKVRDPRAWLYRTGFRLVVDELRRERRQTTAEVGAATAEEAGFSAEFIDAMAALSPEQRLVTFLAYGMDMPLGEVAKLTGSTVAGVKMRLHRVRRVIRRRLKEDARV